MSLADYSHWNEDAMMMWWQEEGRFDGIQDDPMDDDPCDWLEIEYDDEA